MNQQIFKFKTIILPLVFACFALSSTARAAGPARVYPGFNTAAGDQALPRLTSGVWNTALGGKALFSDTAGACNAATGNAALLFNTTGVDNTANGVYALRENTTGSSNTALGYLAGINLTTGDKNIDIGNLGVAGDDHIMRIGQYQTKTFIAGIRGTKTENTNAIPVVIDSSGQLGTASSSERFKTGIRPMEKASEAILALKPIIFHYKSDSTGTPQFGLIAEDVAKVNPNLIVRDESGEVYTVRYDAVNAMLLNEFLKEHHKVEQQDRQLQKQQEQIEALTAGLQKVNDQLELNKPAPRTVKNNQRSAAMEGARRSEHYL